MISQTLFIESYVTDQKILEENARSVKIKSPDVRMKPLPVIFEALLISCSLLASILMKLLGYT